MNKGIRQTYWWWRFKYVVVLKCCIFKHINPLNDKQKIFFLTYLMLGWEPYDFNVKSGIIAKKTNLRHDFYLKLLLW